MRITNNDTDDDTRKISADIYRMNRNALDKALDQLSEEHLEQVEYDSTHIRGRLELPEAGRLILSVPYEKGWQAVINGEETEPQVFGGALMAFDLEAGEYVIELTYNPFGKVQGIAVSLTALLGFGVIAWYRLVYVPERQKKRRGETQKTGQEEMRGEAQEIGQEEMKGEIQEETGEGIKGVVQGDTK